MTFEHDPESQFLKHLQDRTPAFHRNPALERLLKGMADLLGPVGEKVEAQFVQPQKPPLFLVGCPRSGTSAFMQFLSYTDGFAIPTNLLSRFYYAPYIGGLVQEMVTNPAFDFKGEMSGVETDFSLTSSLGKAKGLLAPHEFSHFWRRFLPRYDLQYLDQDDRSRIDRAGLKRGIAAIEHVFNKPFAGKAGMLLYNLDVLIETFEPCLIVYLFREPKWIMQSILRGREAFYGNREMWWSVRPKEFPELQKLDPLEQVAGQVFFTQKSIDDQLEHIPDSQKIRINYHQFCEDPHDLLTQVEDKYRELGWHISLNRPDARSLVYSRKLRIDAADMERLEAAYRQFEKQFG